MKWSKIYLMIYQTIAQADPWQPYENKGKKKPKPGVPEPAFYGAVLVLLCVILVLKHRHK